MSIKELRRKTISGLQKDLTQTRETLREFRFKLAKDEVKNVRKVRELKKKIARILTVLNEKKLS